MSTRWQGGSDRAWRRRRAEIILRDGGLCQLKLDGCEVYATQVHHVRGRGISEEPADLVAACAPCNRAVGDPTRTDPEPEPRTQW
jgi:5-methylcytosine-specific restriction endonuclease McrA